MEDRAIFNNVYLDVFMFYINFGITRSRSQCIIKIRASCNGFSNETKMQSSDAMLTIVDLAGAEREKRTGNQVFIYLFTLCIWTLYIFDMQSHKYVISECICLINTDSV